MATTAIDEEAAGGGVLARDRAHDGRFVTGVLTTGIYCRPSCGARHPARANVRFFGTPDQARAAGLRLPALPAGRSGARRGGRRPWTCSARRTSR